MFGKNYFLENNSNALLLFGVSGAGKTCFITALMKYLYNKNALLIDSEHDKDGAKHFYNLIKEWSNNKLPSITPTDQLRGINFAITKNNSLAKYRIFDLSGESIASIERNFNSTIESLVNNNETSVTVFIFIDPTKPSLDQDLLLHQLYLRLVNHYNYNFNNVALVLTKSDTLNPNIKSKPLSSYIEKDFTGTFNRLLILSPPQAALIR